MPKFHVETQRDNGEWQRFTLTPIEGEVAAQAKLEEVRTFAKNMAVDMGRARLHELTEAEELAELVGSLTPEERDDIVAKWIDQVGYKGFSEALTRAREANHDDLKTAET